jgi:hypothetical protein
MPTYNDRTSCQNGQSLDCVTSMTSRRGQTSSEDHRRAAKRQRRRERQSKKRASSFSCAICYSDIPKERRVTLPNCTHTFCLHCIGHWTASNSLAGTETTCPICRAELCKPEHWHDACQSTSSFIMSTLGCKVGLSPMEVLHQAEGHDATMAFPIERSEIHTRFTHGTWRLTRTPRNRDVRQALFRVAEALDDDFPLETTFLGSQWYQYLQAVVEPITASETTQAIFTHIIEYLLADVGLCSIPQNNGLRQRDKDDMLLSLDSNIDLSIDALLIRGIVHEHSNKSAGSLCIVWTESAE